MPDLFDRLMLAAGDTSLLAAALRDAAQSSDFELFGVPPHPPADPVELRRRFLALSRIVHPDRAPTDDAALLADVSQLAARVNRAYDMLRDPMQRAEYLLGQRGGKTANEDRRVPPELLADMLETREALDAAAQTNDAATRTAIQSQILARRTAVENQIAELCARLAGGDGSVGDELRLALNAARYLATVVDPARRVTG